VQRHFPPIVNIAAVLAFIQMAVIFTIVNLIIYFYLGEQRLPYHPLIPFGIGVLLYWLNEKHFEKREKELVSEIDSQPLQVKIVLHLFTLGLIVFVVWSYLFDGIYNLIK
jgi:hypothetical protein